VAALFAFAAGLIAQTQPLDVAGALAGGEATDYDGLSESIVVRDDGGSHFPR
jgi:hypothetical protein